MGVLQVVQVAAVVLKTRDSLEHLDRDMPVVTVVQVMVLAVVVEEPVVLVVQVVVVQVVLVVPEE
jgi:hypothetical protein